MIVAISAANVKPGNATTLKKVDDGPRPNSSTNFRAFIGSMVAVNISLTVITSIPKIGTSKNNIGKIIKGDNKINQNRSASIRLTKSSNVSIITLTYQLQQANNLDSNIWQAYQQV